MLRTFQMPLVSSVTCGFSSIKMVYSDYPKSLISRINEFRGIGRGSSDWLIKQFISFLILSAIENIGKTDLHFNIELRI